MAKYKHTYCYFVDNNTMYLDYFRSQFNPDFDYTLYTFDSLQHFLKKLSNDSKLATFKVVIINNMVVNHGLNIKTATEFIAPIKSIDKDIEVIILAEDENIDLKASSDSFTPTAFVKKNSEYFIVLYSIISRLISEHKLKEKSHSFNLTLIIALILIAICIVIFILTGILF